MGPSSCPSLDKGRSIKELVFRWVLLNLIPRLFDQKGEFFFSYPWLLDPTKECHGQQPNPYEVIVR